MSEKTFSKKDFLELVDKLVEKEGKPETDFGEGFLQGMEEIKNEIQAMPYFKQEEQENKNAEKTNVDKNYFAIVWKAGSDININNLKKRSSREEAILEADGLARKEINRSFVVLEPVFLCSVEANVIIKPITPIIKKSDC